MNTLIGIDGSSGGFAAVQMAVRLLSPQEDRLALYYAPPDIRLRGASGTCREVIARASAALTQAVLDEGRAQLPEPFRATVHTIAGTRDPRQGITLAANAWHADWIVVGANRRRKVARLFLGSVARSVVHTSRVPVLVVRSPEGETPGEALRVLVAFDGSAGSHEAAGFLKRLIWPEKTVGRVMTVLPPSLAPEVSEWLARHGHDADIEALARTWTHEYEVDERRRRAELVEFCRQLPPPFQASEPIAFQGQPTEGILDTIESEKIGLVVLGSNYKRGIDRLLTGSTSDRVLSHARCSVLIVHEQPQP
jgi:nucleotide-binding universal stress UspA family protein